MYNNLLFGVNPVDGVATAHTHTLLKNTNDYNQVILINMELKIGVVVAEAGLQHMLRVLLHEIIVYNVINCTNVDS